MKISKLLPWGYAEEVVKMILKKKGENVAKQTVFNNVDNESWTHYDIILQLAEKHQKKLKRLKTKAQTLNVLVSKPKKNTLNLVGKSS